jgi:hypothetical protein
MEKGMDIYRVAVRIHLHKQVGAWMADMERP